MQELEHSIGRRLSLGFGALLLLLLLQLGLAIHEQEEFLEFSVVFSTLALMGGGISAVMTIRGVQGKTSRELLRLANELGIKNHQLAITHRRKDEFLAMLAHELRNPLGAISNATNGLEQAVEKASEARDLVDIVRRQTERLTRMVDDLFDASSIAHGKVQLRLSDVDLRDVARRALETARPLVDARRHQLQSRLPEEAVWVHADAARLEQVVVNLLNNATKYTEPGGEIDLALDRMDRIASLQVSDSGCGILPESLPHIFDLFTQLDRPPGDGPRGLGIGLTLVRKLVESHGGTIQARSEGPGKGSCFEVRLPLLEREAASREAEAARSLRILLVDDHEDTTRSLARILEGWKHEIRVAGSGEAALAEAAGFLPEVVLLDLGLPGMDGSEVARRLRAQNQGQAWIVALTGRSAPSPEALESGGLFDRYLIKPVPIDEMRRLLSDAERR